MERKLKLHAFIFGAASITLLLVATPSQFASAQAGLSGATVFKQRCASCHTVVAGKPGGVGPNLAGVVGRKAAAGSFAYSPALKKTPIVWTKPNLDRYLSGPAKMVPGTRMMIALPDAKQRAAVIDYLATTK